MRVAIIGSGGQLAYDLEQVYADVDLVKITEQEMDVTDRNAVMAKLTGAKPDVIINTAAFHKVDDCEKNPFYSFDVNCYGALNVARAAAEMGSACVFISTDYVFGGKKMTPYIEEDCPDPISVYGASKVAGEIVTASCVPKHFIFRTTGLYGKNVSLKGHHFVGLMLKLGRERDEVRVVTDQVLTPTSTLALARKMREVIEAGHYGLYHLTCEGACSWYEFAREIFAQAGLTTKVTPTTSEEFKTVARRPAYSVLENRKLKSIGLSDMPNWQEALREYLTEMEVVKVG